MTTRIADDFDDIARRLNILQAAKQGQPANCMLCRDTGWTTYHWDSHWGVALTGVIAGTPTPAPHPCQKCGNPSGLPAPEV